MKDQTLRVNQRQSSVLFDAARPSSRLLLQSAGTGLPCIKLDQRDEDLVKLDNIP
jgi:hypothetical protein